MQLCRRATARAGGACGRINSNRRPRSPAAAAVEPADRQRRRLGLVAADHYSPRRDRRGRGRGGSRSPTFRLASGGAGSRMGPHPQPRSLAIGPGPRAVAPALAHPLFWWLRKKTRDDQETVADAVAARDNRPDYAAELLALGPPHIRPRSAPCLRRARNLGTAITTDPPNRHAAGRKLSSANPRDPPLANRNRRRGGRCRAGDFHVDAASRSAGANSGRASRRRAGCK